MRDSGMNSISSLLPSTSTPTSDDPRFPPELFLEIFTHADRPTLAALCCTSLALLELATPFLYDTVHLVDLPNPTTPRTPRVAGLLPRLALSSVRTLHLTISSQPPTGAIHPQPHLTKLDHLHIHHSAQHLAAPLWPSLDPLLLHLNPLSVTFSLPLASSPRSYRLTGLAASIWSVWSNGWTRLERIILRGGALIDDRTDRQLRSPFAGGFATRNGSVRLEYDLRTLEVNSVDGSFWAQVMLDAGTFDLPLAPDRSVLVRTSCKERELWVNVQLRQLGVDQVGQAYRNRVEIAPEREEEGEAVFEEMAGWRRRGIVGTSGP